MIKQVVILPSLCIVSVLILCLMLKSMAENERESIDIVNNDETIFVSSTFKGEQIDGMSTDLVPEKEWEIIHYRGSCYHDTIIHAVWLYINPNQELQKYENDSSFVVVKVTAVNKSPMDIYFHGKGNRLRAPIIKESYIRDTAAFNQNPSIWSAYPMKLNRRLAFERSDYLKSPHRELIKRENQDNLIRIPSGERQELIVVIPKREGSYLATAIVEFNEGMYAWDCNGQRVAWTDKRTIDSNKVDLREVKRK